MNPSYYYVLVNDLIENMKNSSSAERKIQLDVLTVIFSMGKGILSNVIFELITNLMKRIEETYENMKDLSAEISVRTGLFSLFRTYLFDMQNYFYLILLYLIRDSRRFISF